jgi:pyruvate kinase
MDKIAFATEQGLESSGARPSGLARFKSTRAVAHAGVELAKVSNAARIVVATEHGNAPRLVAGYRPEIPVTAVSDRIRATRRVQLLPGVDSVIIKEHQRGSETMQAAVAALLDDGRLSIGDRVVAISGSPLAMRGATSTVRMYRIAKDGTIIGAE